MRSPWVVMPRICDLEARIQRDQPVADVVRLPEGQGALASGDGDADGERQRSVARMSASGRTHNMGQEMVTVELQDTNSSALITVPDQAGFKYVVMPMRI